MIGSVPHHLETTAATASAPEMRGWPRSGRCSGYAALHAPEHAAADRKGPGDPAETLRPRHRQIPHQPADRRAAGRAGPDHLVLGRSDHALLVLAAQTGLRVSELTGLKIQDLHLGAGPHVRCHGKGRKDRITPLTTQTVAVLRVWLKERKGDADAATVPHQERRRAQPRRRRTTRRQTRRRRCPSLTGRRKSPRTRCGTPRRWRCCMPASTPPSSRSGSDTNRPRPRRSTCTPT